MTVPIAQAGVVISTRGRDDAVERAFEAAVRQPSETGALLDALCQGRLWLPLADDGRPVDGSAVRLPTLRYLGQLLVPAYTSAARLLRTCEPPPGERISVLPHAVIGAADLARRLPPPLGIALNPGGPASVPVLRPGVAQLAAQRTVLDGVLVSVGPLPQTPSELLAAVRAGLAALTQVRTAAAAWLAVAGTGEGMVIAMTLDSPGDAAARDAAADAVQRAVDAAGGYGWPVDVTFPGEGEPDLIDHWFGEHAAPFYQRAVVLPAPRPATA
jgi:hypothetical protein